MAQPALTGNPPAPAAPHRPGRMSRLAWAPVALLLGGILVARAAGLTETYEHNNLRLALSFTFYTLVSLSTLYLIGHSFLASGTPGLLLLECGVVLWSLAGTVGDLLDRGDQNVNVSIFNTLILLSGLCHLAGAVLTLKPGRSIRAKPLWLAAGCGLSAGMVSLVAWTASAGVLPVFFVPGEGGTLVRYAVLSSAIAAFVLSAGLLAVGRRGSPLAFTSWYVPALLALAVGLFGIMIQLSLWSLVNWLARSAQWLGGFYLFLAALASVRETGAWRITLDTPAWNQRISLWDERLLRFLTPRYLRSLSPAWRYGLALGIVAAATALRWALIPWLGTVAPYNIAYLAAVIAALLLGLGPGLVAVVLGFLAVEVLVLDSLPSMLEPVTLLRLGMNAGIGVFVAVVLHALRVSQVKARQSQTRYHSLFSGMTEGFALHEIICDDAGTPRDYRFLDVNPAFEQLTGLKRDQVIGRTYNQVLPGESPVWISQYGRVALTGEPTRFENYSPVLGRHYEVFAYRPAPHQFAVVFADITARKQAEEALRRGEDMARRQAAWLQGTLDATPALIWIARDRECRTITGNRAAYEFSRVPEGDNLSKTGPAPEQLAHYRIFKDGAELAPNQMPLQRVAASGQPLNDCALEFRFDDGTVRSLVGNVVPVFDVQEQPAGAIAAFMDITDLKQAEAALRRLNETLETRVAERTAEAVEKTGQLRALAAELVEAEQRERKRLAKVLHDHLQQLLVGAKFGVAALRGGARTKTHQQAVEQLGGILDEAIRSARSLTAELSPPILHEQGLAAGLQWLGRQMLQKHNLTVEVETDGQVAIEAEQLRVFVFEAVRELLFNIVKHAATDRARVSMRRTDGASVEVTVTDGGAGFDPAHLDGDAAAAGGFGLFSIRERLSHLGGRMDVTSATGQGSRFTLVVPMRLETTVEEPPPPAGPPPDVAPAPREGVLFSPGKRVRVLLVDDHPIVREGMARVLEDYPDIEVVGEASDGRQAVELAAALQPDVILMDISMPRMTGIEATRVITAQWPRIRVIGLSMHEEADMASAMRRAGAAAYMTKGGPAEDLAAAILAPRD